MDVRWMFQNSEKCEVHSQAQEEFNLTWNSRLEWLYNQDKSRIYQGS